MWRNEERFTICDCRISDVSSGHGARSLRSEQAGSFLSGLWCLLGDWKTLAEREVDVEDECRLRMADIRLKRSFFSRARSWRGAN